MAKREAADVPVEVDGSSSTVLEVPFRSYELAGEDAWWDAEADEVEGYDLVKDEALFSLVGVPFRIYRLIFRAGIQAKGVTWRNDFVTAELRVAPLKVIQSQWDRILTRRLGKLIKDQRNIASPGEQAVINNGSTGFYRQAVEYLEAKELITVPEADPDGNELPKTGPKNECRYDLPASMFGLNEDLQRLPQIEVRFDPQGNQVTLFSVDLRCSRGLRYSDYENEYTDEGLTWYIA